MARSYAPTMRNRDATPVPFEVLLPKAHEGDEDAWRELCEQLRVVAWRVIAMFRLPRADAEDALAATFFRLADNLDRVREPAALPGWVATTAKREVYAIFPFPTERRLGRSGPDGRGIG